ncbi:hypothetical protein [Clostridium sp. JN-9]|uniref:hypothetical protein n=1 Tax=Clostridium sp. JN-9 TaxID=2507159 RepID=UPI000FFE0430|nr:hypothetical protein [Clostridium sp. JN-9]QAT41030.1 hypothetical protein EQM05_12560 [Clostridium sp. JN-9]
MPRKKHEWYPGAKLHVIARGNHRNDIFKDESDYELYLNYLQEAISKLGHTSLAKGSDPWEEVEVRYNKEIKRIVRNGGSFFIKNYCLKTKYMSTLKIGDDKCQEKNMNGILMQNYM